MRFIKEMRSDKVLLSGIGALISIIGAALALIGVIFSIVILPKIGVAVSVSGCILWVIALKSLVKEAK